MLQLVDASLAFGGQTILADVTWAVRDNRRIGLVGPNGAGKTTLLKALSGRQRLDAGTLDVPGGTTVGYLEQDVQEGGTDRSVLAEALEAFGEVLALERREHAITHELDAEPDHASAHYVGLLHELDDVHTALAAAESHTIRPRTEAVLTGLGFDPDDLHRPLRTFSGGWRMRVALARLLLRRPDVLLLDEPTNHLDIDSIGWLEAYLKTYPGTVVLVSHDRYFLDRMVNETAELVQGRLTTYEGNYTYYLETREERRAIQRASYENQQKEIADMERFVERFRAKATKAKQAQSRMKMLDRMDRLEAPPDDAPTVHFRFPMPERSGKVVLELSAFSKGYDGAEGRVEVFREAGPVHVERGDKIALIGRNGAGKSTLARILRGEEPFDGTRTMGHNVRTTFFAQHQADTLDPRDTILDSLRAVARGQSETELRSLAGAFLFRGDDVFKPVAVLSGGERSRVALARTLLTPANFMILDEPTNHLDMASIAVLVEALRRYEGTFVVVSHDRHFLDQVATSIWRVEDGAVRPYKGNYAEYLWQVEHGTAARMEDRGARAEDGNGRKPTPAGGNGATSASSLTGTTAAPAPQKSGPKTKEQKRAEAEARNAAFRAGPNGTPAPAAPKTAAKPTNGRPGGGASPAALRHAHAHTEALVEAKEAEKAALEARLADPAVYDDPDEMRRLTAAYESLRRDLDALYAAWEASAEALAALGA